MWLALERSLFGAKLRAAVDLPDMARAVGVDVQSLFLAAFAGGCALAGFGGVIGAGLMPIEPYYALRYLVLFLVVVGVGGVGNFRGSFVAALLLEVADTLAKFLVPAASEYVFYLLVLGLLLWRPNGLMPPRSAA